MAIIGRPEWGVQVELRSKEDWELYDTENLASGKTIRFTIASSLFYNRSTALYANDRESWLSWTCLNDPNTYIDQSRDDVRTYTFQCITSDINQWPEGRREEGTANFYVFKPVLPGVTSNYIKTINLGLLESEWKPRLLVTKMCDYRLLHFTPIQQLSSSRRAHSISNHLQLDSSYLPSNHTHTETTIDFTNSAGDCKELKFDSAFVEVSDLLQQLHHEWGLASIVDVIWNHTSFDTPWLAQHPEAGYNLVNSPHLHPAYALDVALAQFSQEVAEGKWENAGVRAEVQSEGDVRNICCQLLDTVLPRARLWEYFSVEVEAIVEEFQSTVNRLNGGNHPRPEGKYLSVIQDKQYRRLGSSVDADLILELYNIDWSGVVSFEERMERCCSALRDDLCHLNQGIEECVRVQLHRAVDNVAAHIRYQFLDGRGPHQQKVTPTEPLVPRFFHVVGSGKDLDWQEMETQRGEYVLACNGWVMKADPLVNIAEEGTQAYFQRELIVWDDSIKLRYGSGPADSPWLWEYMRRYTQAMAWVFDGFRLYNCLNTPMNVSEALLDAAREVKPNLYVVANLFTSSEDRENDFVNRLHINTLMREPMLASSPRELGHLVHKYGGLPMGSFLPSQSVMKPFGTNTMLMDGTHDDLGSIQSQTVYNTLPNAALSSITSCATGSCRGYDELVPHTIGVVSETSPYIGTRLYAGWSPTPTTPKEVGPRHGIVAAKKELNALHRELVEQGFNQIHVDQMTEDIIAVTRHSPSTHESVILVAHTAFCHPETWAIPSEGHPNTCYTHVPPLTVPGVVQEVIMEARLLETTPTAPPFLQHDEVVNRLQSHLLELRSQICPAESKFCHLAPGDGGSRKQEIVFDDFCPGSIIVFRVSLAPEACSAVQFIHSFLERPGDVASWGGKGLRRRLEQVCERLELLDLNYALYHCDNEEKDDGHGGGVYIVPGAGPLVYCGLQGIVSMLDTVRDNEDLGHPICDNLRAGDWLPNYTVDRLRLRPGTKELADVLSVVFGRLCVLPRYLIPCYFEALVSLTHQLLIQAAIHKMSKFVQEGPPLVQCLALGSVQLLGESGSAQLPAAVPGEQPKSSLAAGLPHFSTNFMRCRGQDTFIALRGLLLVTGRHQEARDTLLSFAACVRHGLIPNLLSGGTNPRYNCRDAPWWWLQSVQDYCHLVPNGTEILRADVCRIFRHDDAIPDFENHDASPLTEIIQEILQCHVSGVEFRERGAGPSLDKDMTPPGFNVRVGVDLKTGFVYGGNVHNCGTWMNKMGESSWAGNKGVPSTPRDGSAVELVGLCHSTVAWLAKLHDQGLYPYSGVRLPTSTEQAPQFLSFSEWAHKLRQSFERQFWVPEDRTVASQHEGPESGYIHHTGIYKDCFGATQRYADYQLRPNFLVAMVVSPELFTPQNAWVALTTAERVLLGPLGMRTLDPADYVYNGDYTYSADSGNYITARGFNYHQGPEWLWLVGYFLRAKLQFARQSGAPLEEIVSSIHKVLGAHAQALWDSPWKGLPELTNGDGAECGDSCPVHACSMAALLDVMYDLQQFH